MQALIESKGILHVYAHPDDESFGNPATFAFYSDQEILLFLVTLTRGEAGETNGICADGELGAVREKELRSACKILGIRHLDIWDYPDGRISKIPEEEGILRIEEIYRALKPEVVVTFGDDGITGHPDHIAANRWATGAFFRIREKGEIVYPSRLYWRTLPENRRRKLNRPDLICRNDFTTVIDGRSFADIREKAQGCHKIQRPRSDFKQPHIREMGAVDCYIRVHPPWKGGPKEADLFGRFFHPEGTSFP